VYCVSLGSESLGGSGLDQHWVQAAEQLSRRMVLVACQIASVFRRCPSAYVLQMSLTDFPDVGIPHLMRALNKVS